MSKKKKSASTPWVYTDIVKDQFFNPRNLAVKAPKIFDGYGRVGNMICGDIMKMWIWVDKKTKKIKDLKWQTFGCASAIASTSMLSEMVLENNGMTTDQALKIKPQDILKRLGGLPGVKIHCSVLGDKALRRAVKNYLQKID